MGSLCCTVTCWGRCAPLHNSAPGTHHPTGPHGKAENVELVLGQQSVGLQNGTGPLTPEAWFLPPAPQVVESAHVTSTMDTQAAALQGPWKVHLPPLGEPKGTDQEPQRNKLTSGQKKARWDSHLWASCTLLTRVWIGAGQLIPGFLPCTCNQSTGLSPLPAVLVRGLCRC